MNADITSRLRRIPVKRPLPNTLRAGLEEACYPCP